jgi:tetratricopeptide (TPR) repeat protein
MFINEHHKKADALFDQQKYDKALIEFNKALKINPNHPHILSQRGVLFLHLNKKKECMDDMLLALKLEPENSYRYSSLAYALDFFGDTNAAFEAYEKAVELDPEDAIAHNNLGLLLEKQGYQNKAKEKFDRADKLADIENKLFRSIDEIEGKTESPLEQKNEPKGEKLQPKKLEHDKKQSGFMLFKQTFTSKSMFKEFIAFIKSGFKINTNEKD